jgi:8-oxo-dGTP pyrophosphatase MutT (NUDIX family)
VNASREDPPSGPALGPPVASERIYDGEVVNLRVSQYARPDGSTVRREVMDHPGAVVMVPLEDDHVLLVRQPREAVEEMTLELPAGKLDRPDEPPLECARRELAEEVGRSAGTWRRLGGFYTSPAILTEFIHLFLATDLAPSDVEPVAEEGIEVVRWPLADLDELIDGMRDAKSLIGLLQLERQLRTPAR